MSLALDNKAELHVHGFTGAAEHSSRKTPAGDFRTVRRAMFANMARRRADNKENKLPESYENMTYSRTRPLHEVRHFD